MRTILTAMIFICIGSSIASAQEKKKKPQKKGEDVQIFTKVENEAHPDMAAWNRYLNQQARLPDSVAKEIPPGCYTVVVTFIVDIYGGITEVKSEKDPGYGL